MSFAIQVENVSKHYARYAMRRRFATLKSALLGGALLGDLEPEATYQALRDVSFEIEAGSTVAVIGPNGSGKSTLLKVLAGILKPSTGSVHIDGRLAALIELGAGFHPEISGRENIVINGIMLGLPRREIERRIPDIIRFAELEDFIDAPVKTYSSGMYVRLGFSVAVAVEPDILLVDEVLAVGDEQFSHKCLDRFADLKRHGKTVLLVTHALELAETLADRVILIEDGRITATGAPREIIDRYRSHVADREEGLLTAAGEAVAHEVEPAEPAEPALHEPKVDDQPDSWRPRRWGNRRVELSEVALCDDSGKAHHVFQTGDTVHLDITVAVHEPQDDFVFGVAIHGRDGNLAYGTNTELEGYRSSRLDGPSSVRLSFPSLDLLEGSYSVDVAVHTRTGVAFDYRQACLTFNMRSDIRDHGVARLGHEWHFDGLTVQRSPAPRR